MVRMIWGVTAALTLAACSKEAVTEAPRHNGDGSGSLRIAAVSLPQIALNGQTRADERKELTDIVGNDAAQFNDQWVMNSLRTRVVCVAMDGEVREGMDAHTYGSAKAYNDECPALTPVPAIYNVTMGMTNAEGKLYDYTDAEGKTVKAAKAPEVRYADSNCKLVPQVAEGEGARFIYFEGWAQTPVTEATEPQYVDVNVKVANTAVTVEFTPAFTNYFANGATVTLKTKNGSEFTVSTDDAQQHYFWVRPQGFTLSAVGTRQNPGTGLTAQPEDLGSKTMADADVHPQTLYKFVYDVKSGSVSGEITVTLNDDPIGEESLGEVETNPNEQNKE